MEWSTKDDPRLHFVDKATDHVIQTLRVKKLPVQYDKKLFQEGITHISGVVKQGRYSFLTYKQLMVSNFLEEIYKGVELLNNSLPIERLIENPLDNEVISLMTWYLRHLSSFEERLELGEKTNLEYAIDIRLFKIVEIKATSSKKINYLLVKAKNEKKKIITNYPLIKEGDYIPVADLPPKIIYGRLSEGMIVPSKGSSNQLQEVSLGSFVYSYLSNEELGEVFTQINLFLK